MNPDGTYRIDEAYDDGVVCFGPVTVSQLERYARLPRHTVLPSDLESMLCSDDEEFSNGNEENAKDEQFNENCDQSVRSYLDQSKDSTVVQVDEINTTRSTINFDNKENEASSSKYSASSFTSPCASKFVPSADLIATEVLNRYIRMETTLSDESLSEDQDKSAFEDETVSVGDIEKELNQDEIVCENVSFTDVQKREIIHDNSMKSFFSPLPVSSVIEQSYNSNESNLSGDVNNICSLKHRSHEDENDESICSISELEDDSIVPDKYSITPGKQRLFDVRNLKRSFPVKTGILMERIEESTTPVILKTPTSHSALNKVSCTSSEIKTNLDVSLSKSIDFSSSAVDFSDVKDSVCNNRVINVSCGEEKMCINNLCDEPMSTNSFSAENNTLDSNVSLGIINNCSKKQSNVMRQYLDLNQTQIENVSSADINSTINESEDFCDQSQSNFSIIEQTTCSETTDLKKNDESYSIFDDLSKSTLSVIIENRTLEDKEIIVHNDDEKNTEVSNRYIGLENMFTGEAVSVDDKEKEELTQDEIVCENVSFTDVQKGEIIQDNSIKIEITSPLPMSSVIEQFNDAKENNSSDAANNSCSLKFQSHEEKNNESICSISEVEDDSIVPDKCSTTPGKQRLFDVRNLKQSFLVKSGILMDKIEKSTSPVIQKTPISQPGISKEKMSKNILCDEPMCTNSLVDNTLDSDMSLGITNNCSERPSNITKQYLHLNQIQVENVSSTDINSTLNKSEDYCDQSQSNFSIIDQTTCSETSDSMKNDESFSIHDNHSKSTSSVIENKILEDEKNVIDVSYDSASKNIMNEETHNEMLIKSTQEAITIAKNDSKSHVIELSTMNVTSPLEKEIHENVNNFTDQSVIGSVTCLNESEDTIGNITLDSCFLLENSEISRIETKIMSEIENKLRGTTSEQILSQNIESDDWNLSNLTDISTLNTSELILKSEQALQSLNNQRHTLNTTDTMSESLAEYNKIEQMLFEENDKVCQFKTPKTQKLLDLSTVKKPFVGSLGTQQLLDFSIVQQSPFLVNSAKKQKLINFSIVDQSPAFKTTPQTSFNHNSTKADTSIDFNSTNQMWDLGAMPANEIDFQKCFPNSPLTISSSNVELVADESVKTNLSDHSDDSFNQTITETNLMKPNTSVNQQKVEDKGQLTEKDDLAVSTNKQIEVNVSSNSLKTTVAQNESCNEQPVNKLTIKGLNGSERLFETSNIGSIIGSNQQVTLSSNEYGIQDFSIVEQSTQSKSKNVENIIPADSAYDVSNLIEMSVANTPCNKQFVVSNIPILTVTSHEEPEKTLNSSSSDVANNTAIHFEESRLSGEELLTDVQMNDVSLLVESSDKSSVSESFHSIELDHHIQEDKKRKIEPIQGYHTEKKVKVNADDELKTPTTMLYKIRNMFRSSEKQLHISSNTKENDSGAFRQKLDFNMCNENRANVPKSLNYKKLETFGKSKIPCKVTDVSMIQNEGSNVSSSMNDNNVIKPKKTIPKFTGLPVLSDVSNSTKKCPGSRTPSRFQQ